MVAKFSHFLDRGAGQVCCVWQVYIVWKLHHTLNFLVVSQQSSCILQLYHATYNRS